MFIYKIRKNLEDNTESSIKKKRHNKWDFIYNTISVHFNTILCLLNAEDFLQLNKTIWFKNKDF